MERLEFEIVPLLAKKHFSSSFSVGVGVARREAWRGDLSRRNDRFWEIINTSNFKSSVRLLVG